MSSPIYKNWTFCVLDVLYPGRSVTGRLDIWTFCILDVFYPGRSVTGRLVTGRFVTGRFVGEPRPQTQLDLIHNSARSYPQTRLDPIHKLG